MLALDASIRSVALVDGYANVRELKYRKAAADLTNEEMQIRALQSVLRMGLSSTNKKRNGSVQYLVNVNAKTKFATIPVGEKRAVLLVSFDRIADHESVIREKILPFLTAKSRGPAQILRH